ncbi:unnamed protein product [Prorocentrum cordatum]|uniref:Uncharacterized protein n=1 Tax=Prorocentrum cordatum TaxID=2364126 RepID=A0ABN9TIA4_9DINO|nr:unnamed protein product [Polarella glacialis]
MPSEDAALRAAFPRLQVEQASGEKRTPLSTLIRRCIAKFSNGLDDVKPHYRGQRRRTDSKSLDDAMSSLSDASVARATSAIEAAGYPERPHRNAVSFVKDIAALRNMPPRGMGKTTGKKNIVWGSLRYATSPAQLEHLLNPGRYHCAESRHSGWARKSLPLTERHQERELLQDAFLSYVMTNPWTEDPFALRSTDLLFVVGVVLVEDGSEVAKGGTHSTWETLTKTPRVALAEEVQLHLAHSERGCSPSKMVATTSMPAAYLQARSKTLSRAP